MERVNYLLPDEPRWPRDPGRPVIELCGVTKRFRGEAVLERLDLPVQTGSTTVICGQSGSGKSVLLKLMNGLLLPDEGQVLLFGEDTREVSTQRLLALRKRVTMMFQSYALMDSLTVTENVAFPLSVNTSMAWRDIVGLVQELLEMLDLGDAGGKLPSQLSGGMKKRVSLARAVISNPEVVLFDEPTTGLDPIMIEFVDGLIEQTQDRYGITSVVVSHDMTSTLRLADTVAMLKGGRITVSGPPREVRDSGDELAEVFFTGAGERLSAGTFEELDREAPEVDPEVDHSAAVELRGVHKSFGAQHVLRGIDLEVPRNMITVLIGGSGSGKSVIMKHIIGIFRADRGTVKVLGKDLGTLDERGLLAVRRDLGMLFQGAALLDAMTVLENVTFPLRERGVRFKEARERALEVLEQLHITEIRDRFPSEISNGQRKRTGLARAIVTRPKIMIYDEPTTGQDPVMTRYVDDMIVEAQELFDITSIVVSHDMIPTFRIGHQIAMLHKGKIRVCGGPETVMSSDDPFVRRFIFAGSDEGEAAAREIAAGAQE